MSEDTPKYEQSSMPMVDIEEAKKEGLPSPYEAMARIKALEEAVDLLLKRANCEHVPLSLDGSTPFYIMAIADEREISVLVPGQRPEPTFALGICTKCWQVYKAIDRMAEVMDPPAAPLKMVKPGEEVVG